MSDQEKEQAGRTEREAVKSPADAGDEAEETAGADRPDEASVEEGREPAAAEGERVAPATAAEPKRRSGAVALVIAIIALLAAAGIAGLGHYRAQQLEQQLAALPPAIERNAGRVDAIERRADELAQSLRQQDTQSQRRDQALEETIGALREQIGRDQSGWILAEAEYLLLVANHRLRLERDTDTALEALELADARLRETGDPALIGIREKIAAEASALKTLSRPDLTGLSLTLMGLANQVDKLPLQAAYLPVAPTASTREAGVEPAEDWRELAGAVWSDLKGLVTVRRREEAVRPMLAPEQQYFLRQNLRLQLESARLALLRADQQQLDRALKTARDWIPQFFDDRSPATRGMLNELERLAGIEIRPELPDISGSLKALREHMRQLAKQEQRG